jgi:hypothetical protein
LLSKLQAESHKLFHIKWVVRELGMGCVMLRVLTLTEEKWLLVHNYVLYLYTSASRQILSGFSQVVYGTPLQWKKDNAAQWSSLTTHTIFVGLMNDIYTHAKGLYTPSEKRAYNSNPSTRSKNSKRMFKF